MNDEINDVNNNNGQETEIESYEMSRQSGEEIKARVKLLKKKALSLPSKSGVYLMKSSKQKIIYIGKANILSRRVSQYFIFYPHRDTKTNKLVENIHDFDFIITGNEIEALILENQLIKLHTPKYNIKLKDDKSYPYLKVDTGSEYPRLKVVRSRSDDGNNAIYFGPYSNKGSIFMLIDEINKHFKLPTCSNEFPRDIGKSRPCLSHRINRCVGLCTGAVPMEEYKNLIDNVVMFIKGEYKNLIKEYDESMKKASEDLDFEKAAQFRDKKFSLQKLRDKQKIVDAPNVDKDIFGLYVGDTSSCIAVLNVRYGILTDKITEHFSYDEILDEDGFVQYIQSYYFSHDFVPKNIFVSMNLSDENINLTQDWLSQKLGAKVTVTAPKKGENKTIVNLAVTNAKESQRLYKEKYSKDTNKLAAVAKLLSLEVLPQRIEAFDVSNSGADNITCGMIVIQDGNFKKGDYKSFNIKSIDYQDDYTAMSEAVSRRFRNRDGESSSSVESFAVLPDLILLDGGKAHVSVIKKVLDELGVDIPVFGMVKDEFHKTRDLSDGINDINIAKDQSVFIFFYKIQEEVHRYSLHRMDIKRRRSMKKSVLENIKGLGPAKIKILLQHFESIDGIKSTGVEELEKVKGITKSNADAIVEFFSADPDDSEPDEEIDESEGV